MTNAHPSEAFTTDESDASLRVVEVVAAVEGADVETLGPPLYRAIDPTALDRLVESADPDDSVCVSFQYRGYTVSVEGDGTVTLE